MSDTIWERYGGYGFVAKAVDDFYARVLLSRDLAPYFVNINMEKLRVMYHASVDKIAFVLTRVRYLRHVAWIKRFLEDAADAPPPHDHGRLSHCLPAGDDV